MKAISHKILLWAAATVFILTACESLTDKNINPNGVSPQEAHPNLILPTILTEAAKNVVNLGFGNIAGVVQHTQKNGWGGGHNNYDWSNQSWSGQYAILRNNKFLNERSEELGLEFHQGVSMTMKAFVFGMITDLWGDAPYSKALNGDQGGNENLLPQYDSQQAIYAGITSDLEAANILLSKPQTDYTEVVPAADVIYGGDAGKWQKLANSLMLRYYMRISEKDPATAQAGIEKIINDPGTYPLITSNEDNAMMEYVGNSSSDAWPSNAVFDASESNYTRIQMCVTLIEALQRLQDPRITVWAEKVQIPLVVEDSLAPGTDAVIDGVRYIHPAEIPAGVPFDTNPDYVGLPAGIGGIPAAYNLNPVPTQGGPNPHVSQISEMYKGAAGGLLQSRVFAASETHFILAEAALKGWNVGGSAQTYYETAVTLSLESWELGDAAGDYLLGPAAYDGSLEQLMEQKWISNWTTATEAWYDYRRTGLPALQAGQLVKREAIPLRFYYMQDELNINADNANSAVNLLEETAYSQGDGKNSAWSKSWLLQGTGKPY